MKTLTICARKGGVSKSLCARSFAVQAAINGLRSAILDLDPQETSVLWARRRPHPAPAVEGIGDRNVKAALSSFEAMGADRVYLDTAPHNQPLMNIAMEAADACLIPTGTGPEEVEQVAAVVDIAKRLRIPTAIILCRTQPRVTTTALARSALATFGLPICPVAISQAVVHVYSAAEGLTASEREPGSRASEEINQAYNWIEETLFDVKESGELRHLGEAGESRAAAAPGGH